METVWDLKDHTKGKHELLRAYLDAWYPILMQSGHKRVVFIDAFAGPGEYTGGELGSPSIAINALCERKDYTRLAQSADVEFIFIEKDEAMATHLREAVIPRIGANLPKGNLPLVITGSFDEEMNDVLGRLDDQTQRAAPSFVMIDPFGYSGYPMSLVRRILANRSAEVFITFMGSFINRFAQTTPQLVTDTFGTSKWKEVLGEDVDAEFIRPKRRKMLAQLYEKQLREAGAEYVLSFNVHKTANDYVYTLFFATGNLKGCEVMKDAMWKVAPNGDYRFIGAKASQFSLSEFSGGFVDYTPLVDDLVQEFGRSNWISVDDADKFMASDRTGFRKAHLRQKVLAPMEKEGRLVKDPSDVRKGAFPSGRGLRFKFVEPPKEITQLGFVQM